MSTYILRPQTVLHASRPVYLISELIDKPDVAGEITIAYFYDAVLAYEFLGWLNNKEE